MIHILLLIYRNISYIMITCAFVNVNCLYEQPSQSLLSVEMTSLAPPAGLIYPLLYAASCYFCHMTHNVEVNSVLCPLHFVILYCSTSSWVH